MAYESKFKRADIDELFEAVLTLKDSEDCYRFFEDICTINEIHAIFTYHHRDFVILVATVDNFNLLHICFDLTVMSRAVSDYCFVLLDYRLLLV